MDMMVTNCRTKGKGIIDHGLFAYIWLDAPSPRKYDENDYDDAY